MVSHEELKTWLARGKQRRAIVASLNGIMTGAQLCLAARVIAPKVTARDIRAILRQLEEYGLVRCLNPQAPCGRLFEATDEGRVVFAGIGSDEAPELPELPKDVDPSILSYLLRAPVRRAVFRTVAQDNFTNPSRWSASTIKRVLRGSCPLTLNQTSRSLHELKRAGLIAPEPQRFRQNVYRPTNLGERLAMVLGYRQRIG